MAHDEQFINNITPQTYKWTVHVQIIEKTDSIQAMYSPTKYQRLILADTQGTRVQAVIFGTDINKLSNTLKLFHKYSISNAIVKPSKQQYRIVPHPYQWQLTTRTLIKEINNNEPLIPPQYQFLSMDQLHDYADSGIDITLLAIVLLVNPPRTKIIRDRELPVQDIRIINQQMKPITITLWDRFVHYEGMKLFEIQGSHPVLFMDRIKVTTFGGLSLSTKQTSYLIINPTLPQAEVLHSWWLANEATIQAMPIENNTSFREYISPPPTEDKIVPIQSIPMTISTPTNYWVKAKLIIKNLEQKFWFMSCGSCANRINVDCGTIFSCANCGNTEAQATPRCMIEVQLEDETAAIPATVFGLTAESILSVTATVLMQNTDTEGTILPGFITPPPHDQDKIILLRAIQFESQFVSRRKFTVTSVHDYFQTTQAQETTITPASIHPNNPSTSSSSKAKIQLFPDSPTPPSPADHH